MGGQYFFQSVLWRLRRRAGNLGQEIRRSLRKVASFIDLFYFCASLHDYRDATLQKSVNNVNYSSASSIRPSCENFVILERIEEHTAALLFPRKCKPYSFPESSRPLKCGIYVGFIPQVVFNRPHI